MNTENKPKETKPKQKTCFVIMPIADMDDYDSGHFHRVYTHIIKPACEKAGFIPLRADDIASSNYIIIDILQKILDSEMVLCDLSGRNPNVLYELGIRQAFNLPTVLIKDIKTNKIFDIQGLRYTEYNQILRVDEVFANTEMIAKALTETEKATGKDVNSLIQLLAVKPATRPSNVELSNDTSVILSAIKDLATRVSTIEQTSTPPSSTAYWNEYLKQTTYRKSIPPIKKTDDGGYLINGKPFEIGDEVYQDGNMLGILADANPTTIFIKNKTGSISKMNVSDMRFQFISDIPF